MWRVVETRAALTLISVMLEPRIVRDTKRKMQPAGHTRAMYGYCVRTCCSLPCMAIACECGVRMRRESRGARASMGSCAIIGKVSGVWCQVSCVMGQPNLCVSWSPSLSLQTKRQSTRVTRTRAAPPGVPPTAACARAAPCACTATHTYVTFRWTPCSCESEHGCACVNTRALDITMHEQMHHPLDTASALSGQGLQHGMVQPEDGLVPHACSREGVSDAADVACCEAVAGDVQQLS
jgi:hypothetical protein